MRRIGLRHQSNNSNGLVAPKHPGCRGLAWQARFRNLLGDNAHRVPVAGSLDGSGHVPGKAYLPLPDDLAVKMADVVGYPLAIAVVKHDIGSARPVLFPWATQQIVL